jgi:hypothetical protein
MAQALAPSRRTGPLARRLAGPQLAGGGGPVAPILAPDTWYFGGQTAASAGDKYPVNLGGTITSYSLTDASGKFAIDTTTGKVTVAPGQTLGAGPYPLSVTATGPGGPDTEVYNAVCSGLDPEGYDLANTWSVASQAQFDAALTAIGTAAGGARTIMFRGGAGDYAATRCLLSNKPFANRVTLTTHANENRAWIKGGTVAGSRSAVKLTNTAVNNLRLDRLKLSTEAFQAGTDSAVVEIDQFVAVAGLEVKRCEIFYNGLPPISALATATGVRPEGITFHGTATITGGVLIQDCDIHDLEYGVRQIRGDGVVRIQGCDFHGFIQDAIQLNLTAGQTNTEILDVDIWDMYASKIVVDIHGDMIQLNNGLSQDWPGLKVYRCRLIQNIQGSDVAGMYLVGANGGYHVKGHVRGCLIVQDGYPTNPLYSNRAEDYTVEDCTIVTPSWAVVGQGSIVIGSSEAAGTNTVRNCVSMRAPSGIGLVTSNNVALGDLPSSATKAGYFAGDGSGNWNVTSIVQAMTKFAALTSGTLYTSNPRIGAIGTGVVTFSPTRPGSNGFFTERPVNTVAPAISGTPTDGQTLTGSNGTWSGSPTAYAYQWFMDGLPLSGQTANTLLLTNPMVGGVITFQVTASNTAGGTAATSASVGPVAGAPSYDSDAQTLFTYWAVTNGLDEDTTHKNLANTLVTALKSAGVWSKLDILYVFAVGNRANARVNWKNPGTYTITEVGSMSWTADRHFTAANNTSNYLKTGWRPFDGGTYQFTLNTHHAGVYVRASASENNMAELGAGRFRLSARQFGQNWNVIDHVNSTLAPAGPSPTTGHSLLSRTSNSNVDLYHATIAGSTTQYGGNTYTINQATIDSELTICGLNNGTHPTITMAATSNRSVSIAHAGASLNSTEQAAMEAAFRAYLSALGAI